MKNPIIAALDVDDLAQARHLVEALQPHVGGFKIGPRLTLRADAAFFKELKQAGIFFFDHKFFDIPSTTVASVKVAAELGADWVTVHALNGPACLVELAAEEKRRRLVNPAFRILVVTVLTSFSEQTLPPIWKSQSISASVASLAESAAQAGLDALVCSPEEIKLLKSKKPGSFLVVPGIRPIAEKGPVGQRGAQDDQARVATPEQALTAGASALVIGRPLIAQADPAAAAKAILSSLQSGSRR